jgi:TorA maturation chaperone TorD
MTTRQDCNVNGAAALRDFFAAANAAELRGAALRISRHFGLELEEPADWTGVEYDYNRMFIGPAAVPAPPYASAYQEEPALMGAPALEARRFYRELGLTLPDQGTTPDDHLAYELDALVALLSPLAHDQGGPDAPDDSGDLGDLGDLGDPESVEARERAARFVRGHMAAWLPRFIDAARGASPATRPVATAVEALSQWFEHALSALGSAGAHEDTHTQNRRIP